MRRPLGVFEATQINANAHFPFNVVGVVCLADAPAAETVRESLRLLRERHPLARVRVVSHDGGLWFDTRGTPEISLRVLPRTSAGHWQTIVEEELGRDFDVSRGPLIRAAYLAPTDGSREGDLIITFQHAIIDAASGTRFVRELLSLCQHLDAGEHPPRGAPMDFAPAAETLFPLRYGGWRGFFQRARFIGRQMADEVQFQYRSRGVPKAPMPPSARSRILPVRLSEGATSALVRRCRTERLTLNSVLCAALMLTVREQLYGGVGMPLRNFIFANLRPYLARDLADDELGGYFAMLRLTTRVPADADLWQLAHAVNDQIYAAARRGDKYAALLLSRDMMRLVLGLRAFRMGHTALSYTGVAQLPRRFGPIRVTGLHGFVSNFELGPEYTAQVRLFARCLWWDIVYLDGDMDHDTAVAIADGILCRLGHSEASG